MINEIHFWQFPKKEIYILLDKKFRRLLIKKAMKNTNSKNNYQLSLVINKQSQKYNLQTKFNGGDIGRWLIGMNKDKRTNVTHPKFIPLWVIIELNGLAKLKLEKIEKHILGYRSGGSGNIIHCPKLPIKIIPEFDSIIIHLFADGYVNNKISTPSYTQYIREDRELFINKLKKVFGEFEGRLQKNRTFRFPKAITQILSHYYKIPTYLSAKAKIPNEILKKNKSHKLACITSFILDEGNIRDCICCFSINKFMLSQMRYLFQSCGYECNPLRYGSKRYWFSMKNKHVNQFYEDLMKLKKIYATCNLGSKHKLLYRLYLKPRSGR